MEAQTIKCEASTGISEECVTNLREVSCNTNSSYVTNVDAVSSESKEMCVTNIRSVLSDTSEICVTKVMPVSSNASEMVVTNPSPVLSDNNAKSVINLSEFSSDTHKNSTNVSRIESAIDEMCPRNLNTGSMDKNEGYVDNSAASNNDDTITMIKPAFQFKNLKVVSGAWEEFCSYKNHRDIFLKGCKWSPDGTCLLTNSEDSVMRLFDLPSQLYNRQSLSFFDFPELKASVKTKIGGLVYDYAWYPLMTSIDQATCCFVTTSFSSPVHLWDAYTGELRCSYRAYNIQDELHAALSVAFDSSGELLLCGYKDCVKIFNTDVPGRDCITISTKGVCEQRGLVSCIAVNPSMPNIFAAGTYTKSVGLYSTDGHGMCLLAGQQGGLTRVTFSADGSRLFTAGRKDPEILCWDLRQLGTVLCVMRRPHNTNQRLYLDLTSDDRYLLSGSTDGSVYVWDLHNVPSSGSRSENCVLQPCAQWQAHDDCVNGLSVHRHIPLVATASGQRHIPDDIFDDEDELLFELKSASTKHEDSVKLWWAGHIDDEQIDQMTLK